MNLISEIASHIAAGLSTAESAMKLRVEHAIEVSEDWVRKIIGADGFANALEEAKAAQAVAPEPPAVEDAQMIESDTAGAEAPEATVPPEGASDALPAKE